MEGDERRDGWLRSNAVPALQASGRRHGLLIAHPGDEVRPDGVVVELLGSDRPFEQLDPSYTPSLDLDQGLVLTTEGTWSEAAKAQLLWGWSFGHGQEIRHWYDESVLPLFASRLPPWTPPVEPDQAPVALARVTAEGPEPVEWVCGARRPWLDGVRVLGKHDTKLTHEQAEAGRAEYLQRRVLPVVQRTFSALPVLRSAVLMVAQYWADNASDEVHLQLIWSERDAPDPRAEGARHQDNGMQDRPADPVNLPSLPAVAWTYDDQLHQRDDDPDPVPLFAAYCVEGANQDEGGFHHWRPYALFHPGRDGVDVELVGHQVRPWLDGERLD